jgi:hypothetical protein
MNLKLKLFIETLLTNWFEIFRTFYYSFVFITALTYFNHFTNLYIKNW